MKFTLEKNVEQMTNKELEIALESMKEPKESIDKVIEEVENEIKKRKYEKYNKKLNDLFAEMRADGITLDVNVPSCSYYKTVLFWKESRFNEDTKHLMIYAS